MGLTQNHGWHLSLKCTWKRRCLRDVKGTAHGVFYQGPQKGEGQGGGDELLRWSTQKPLDRVRGPCAVQNICIFCNSVPNLSGGTKEKHTAHVPAQVTTGACLFRSGTYRAQRDKVHVICFPEKGSPGLEEIYKKRLQLQGPGMCLPWGHAFPVPGPPSCWGTLVPGISMEAGPSERLTERCLGAIVSW